MEIPQDIIDNIIDQFRDDRFAVKRYTTVSRSFLRSCRRILFSFVILNNPKMTKRLYLLMTSVPEISLHIRTLIFVIREEQLGGIEAYHAWLKEDEILPKVLGMVLGLRFLGWNAPPSWTLRWEDLSTALRSSLTAALHSPDLTQIKISQLTTSIPMSIFKTFSRVKGLNIGGVGTDVDSENKLDQIIELPQLEVLDFGVYPSAVDLFTPTPNTFPKLRRLSFRSGYGYNATLYQQVIRAAAETIEGVMWNLGETECNTFFVPKTHRRNTYMKFKPATIIDLSVIRNLRSLTLTCSISFIDARWRDTLNLIVIHLRNLSVSQSLKELTIGFRFDSTVDAAVLSTFDGWRDVDPILARLPNLRQVMICSQTGDEVVMNLLRSISGYFSRTATRRILFTLSSPSISLENYI
jgi:hypothetical protein